MTTTDDTRPATIADLRWAIAQVNKRIDDLRSVMLWGFGVLVALFLALLGVILSGAG